MTEHALSQGDIVVATLRKPEVLSDLAARYSADRLLLLKVDVLKQEDIDEAFERTRSAFGRLDVVFVDAGYGVLMEVEGTPDDKAREVFETNFWGATNVGRAAVNEPGKRGIILQVSSVTGYHASPGFGYYTGSMVGNLDRWMGFSDGPRERICVIEPGAFHINGHKGAVVLPQHADGSFATSALRQTMEGAVLEGDPEKFTWIVYEVVQGGKISKGLPMGLDALEMMNLRIENLKATGWSVGLGRTDGGSDTDETRSTSSI
ncbi:uncharacterized protein EDB93DRAFT_1143443 [Suillus bovinus]|uniref:uncharacterized protein n=1 Tax=Suillus bovinus TaxID=48563 RepID=UPI001B87095D|nr:uncharacterized protein EDB93DRAFT_1143443 [Suillus bovinus]KAG2149064.1 hypothetical protein EDB93DRAFT_1143443 [Suillus bovinus]